MMESHINELMMGMEQRLIQAKELSFESFNPEQTVLVILDMVKGFSDFGNLSSERVHALSSPISDLAQCFDGRGFETVVFADSHSKESPEFDQYPVHCLAGSEESELIEGLQNLKHMHLIRKNSTNGFLEPEFQRLLKINPDWQQFIVVGNCTDICVLQFTSTLKAAYNRMDLNVQVCVPVNLVATYDAPHHPGDDIHLFALYLMEQGGVELVQLMVPC